MKSLEQRVSPEHAKTVREIQATLPHGRSKEFFEGMLKGYKLAVMLSWGQELSELLVVDPYASQVFLTTLAIEEEMNNVPVQFTD